MSFIQEGIAQNVRMDGRGRLDYRPMALEVNLVAQANGSARLVLSDTDVLVGIKAELAEPDAATPTAGRIHVSVECCPSASPEFEGRGAEELNVQLARFTESILHSASALNLSALSLIPGRQCWALYVDVMVLDSGGNLFDAISIAVRAALTSTTIPRVHVVEKPGGQYELELSDDPEDMIRLDASNVPVCVTFSQIGAFEVIDATLEEEGCLSCRTTYSVSKDGTFSSSQKGYGAVDVKTLREQVKIARRVAQQIIEKMDAALEAESHTTKIGFFM